jgi:hypothetical protein
MKKLYYAISRVCDRIVRYISAFSDHCYNKAEAIAEKEYNQLVEDFYENGKGYYGNH